MNFCVLLGIFSRITTLLEETDSMAQVAYYAGIICVKNAGCEGTRTKGPYNRSFCTGLLMSELLGVADKVDIHRVIGFP